MRYISVRSFEKHQHYKDRRPPWIKLHAEVLDDYAFSCLQDASKAHLMLLWVLASKLENRIPYDLAYLTRQLGATSAIDLEELITHGFIEVSEDDSKPLASRKQSAMPETEGETETETEKKKPKGAAAQRGGRVRAIRPPAPWMGAMRQAWRFGSLPAGSATDLQPVVADIGEAEAVERMKRYCRATEARFASVRDFVAKHAAHATDRPDGGSPIGQAAVLWSRYKAANLLTRWDRSEYERIGTSLVAAGDYPSVDAFLAELRQTKPWTLADARTDGYAINELAQRLAQPTERAS